MRRSRSRMRGGDEAKQLMGEEPVSAQESAAHPKKHGGDEKDKHASGKEGFGTMAGGRKRSRRMSKRITRKTNRTRSHRRRSHHRRTHHRRGGMGNVRRTLAKAIVPFGLWGAQKLMRRKKNRKTMKRMGKRVSSLL